MSDSTQSSPCTVTTADRIHNGCRDLIERNYTVCARLSQRGLWHSVNHGRCAILHDRVSPRSAHRAKSVAAIAPHPREDDAGDGLPKAHRRRFEQQIRGRTHACGIDLVIEQLKASGYRVYPVNHRAKTIDGDPCYPSLASLPERPGVVDVVVPPKIGLRVAEEAAAAGIARIWFQPGAESSENVAYAQSLGLNVIHDACALVERRNWE